MGERGPENFLSKGPVCVYLDKLSRLEDAATRLTELRQALIDRDKTQPEQVGDILRTHMLDHFQQLSIGQRTAIVDYLKKRWLSPQRRWWQHIDGVADIFADGLIVALRHALFVEGDETSPRQSPLPITSVWVVVGVPRPAGNMTVKGNEFRIEISATTDSVALVFMSPWPEAYKNPMTLPDEVFPSVVN